MPTTLPVNFSALPYAARRRPSLFSGVPVEIAWLAAWAIVMLTVSYLSLRHGTVLDTGAIFP